MEIREAVRTAKMFVAEMFDGEGITDIGLEEIDDTQSGNWKITIGFERSFGRGIGGVLSGQRREYKIIEIARGSGEVKSVRHRSLGAGG